MLPLILFLVLSLAAMAWSSYSKISQQSLLPREDRQYTDLLTLGLPALAVLVNALLVYKLTTVGLTVTEHLIQMLSCCAIVPLVYMHFAWHVNRRAFNAITLVLWLLCLPIFMTTVVLSNPYAPIEPFQFPLKPFAFYVVSHGEKLWGIYMGDLMVILQSIVVLLHIVSLVKKLRSNGLRFSRSIKAFFVWCGLTAIFIATVSSLNMVQLSSSAGTWCYFVGMTISIVTLNVPFALNLDLHPVETEQGKVVENVDVYLDNLYADLSLRMEEQMDKEQVFRQPGFTAEDMSELLHTDRKILSQMMMSRYGIYFSEYLNNRRLEYAQQLLLTTDKKMESVAEESGFTDRSHMNRFFKQKFNCTPSQWVKENSQS